MQYAFNKLPQKQNVCYPSRPTLLKQYVAHLDQRSSLLLTDTQYEFKLNCLKQKIEIEHFYLIHNNFYFVLAAK